MQEVHASRTNEFSLSQHSIYYPSSALSSSPPPPPPLSIQGVIFLEKRFRYAFVELQEKREKVEAAKLPAERRPIPLAPAELESEMPTSAADIDAFNARMFDYYNNRFEIA